MRTKVLVLFCSMLLSVTAMAQKHLTFKGVPITGSMTTFCQQLKSKGFRQIGSEKNVTLFNVLFTGREANVEVGATADGQNVHSVVVFFEPSEEWRTLVDSYNYYKEIYTRKYGKPVNSVEKNPSRSDENIFLMTKLNQGTVTWASEWEVEGGTIELSIEKGSELISGVLIIRYHDTQNIEAKIAQDMEDI